MNNIKSIREEDLILPYKKGDKFLVKKGSLIKTLTHPRYKEKIAKKNYHIKIFNVQNGVTISKHGYEALKDYSPEDPPLINVDGKLKYLLYPPKITWSGPSGYWCDLEIDITTPTSIGYIKSLSD